MFQQVIFKNIDPFSVSGEMIISNHKYSMSEVKTSVYSVQMRLVIMNLQKQDLGGYKCISKNSIGDAEGNIRLYGECSWIIRLRGSQTLNFSAFQLLPLPPFMFTYQKEFFFFATTGTPLIIHICTVFFFIQNYFDKQNFVRNANQREQNKVRKEYRTSKGWAIVINPLSAVGAYRCLAKAIDVD